MNKERMEKLFEEIVATRGDKSCFVCVVLPALDDVREVSSFFRNHQIPIEDADSLTDGDTETDRSVDATVPVLFTHHEDKNLQHQLEAIKKLVPHKFAYVGKAGGFYTTNMIPTPTE